MEHPQSTISSSSSSSSDAFPTSSDGGSSSSSSSSSSSRGLTDSLKHFPPSHAHPHSHSHHRRQPSPPPSTTSGSSQSSADDTPTHKKHEKKTPTKATGYPSSTTSSEDSSSSSSSTESNRRTLESIAHANQQHNPHTNVPPVNTKLANNNNTSNVSMLSPSSSPSHPLRLRGGYVDPEPASPSRTPPLDAAAPYKLPSSLKPASSSSSSSSVLPMAEIARQRSVSASSPTKLDKKAILKHKHRRASSDSSSSNGSNTSPLEHQSESPTSGSSESDTSPTMDHAASPSLPPAAAPAASTNFHHTKPIRSARHLHHQLHHHPHHHHHPYHLHRPASATTAPSAASTSSSSMTPSPDAMFHHNTTIPTESSANAASIAARQHQSAFQQKRMQTQQNRLIHQQQAHPHPPHHPPSHPHHTQHHPQLHPHANRPAQPRNYPLPRPTGGSMNVAGPSSSADESLHLDDLSVYTDAPSVGSSDASSLYGQPQMALTHSTSGGGFPSTSSGMSGHTLMSEQMSSSDSDSITMQMNPSPSHCCEDECSHGRRPSRSDSEHTDWNRFVSPVPGDISTDEDLATTLYMDEQRTQLDRLAQHLQGTKLRSHKDRPPQHQPPPPHPHPAKTSTPSSNESMRTSDPESDGSSSQEILPNVSLPSSVD